MNDAEFIYKLNEGRYRKSTKTWNELFVEHRLVPDLCHAIENGRFSAELKKAFEVESSRVNTALLKVAQSFSLPLLSNDMLTKDWLDKKGKIVQTLLHCAEIAAKCGDSFDDDLNTVIFNMFGTLSDSDKERKTGCIQTLRGISVRKKVSVWVALYNKEADTGSLAKLEIEALSKGKGRIYQHPLDWIPCDIKADFLNSIEAAWKIAKGSVTDGLDARWRLLNPDNDQPIPDVGGASAGGAAAVGFYHALGDTQPDKRLIYLAAIENGKFVEVDGVKAKTRAIATAVYEEERRLVAQVKAKTRAIAASGLIDKIVVVSEKNREEAEDQLRQCVKNNLIAKGQIKVELVSE